MLGHRLDCAVSELWTAPACRVRRAWVCKPRSACFVQMEPCRYPHHAAGTHTHTHRANPPKRGAPAQTHGPLRLQRRPAGQSARAGPAPWAAPPEWLARSAAQEEGAPPCEQRRQPWPRRRPCGRRRPGRRRPRRVRHCGAAGNRRARRRSWAQRPRRGGLRPQGDPRYRLRRQHNLEARQPQLCALGWRLA